MRYVRWQFYWGNYLMAMDVSMSCGNSCLGDRPQWQPRQQPNLSFCQETRCGNISYLLQLAMRSTWSRQHAYALFCSGNSSWGNRPLQPSRFTLTPTQVWQWSYSVQKSSFWYLVILYEYIASSIVLPRSRVGNKVPGGSSRPAYPHRFPGVAI